MYCRVRQSEEGNWSAEVTHNGVTLYSDPTMQDKASIDYFVREAKLILNHET